jgi:hypothetical protein
VDGTNGDILTAGLRANLTQDDAVNTSMIKLVDDLVAQNATLWKVYAATTPDAEERQARGGYIAAYQKFLDVLHRR